MNLETWIDREPASFIEVNSMKTLVVNCGPYVGTVFPHLPWQWRWAVASHGITRAAGWAPTEGLAQKAMLASMDEKPTGRFVGSHVFA